MGSRRVPWATTSPPYLFFRAQPGWAGRVVKRLYIFDLDGTLIDSRRDLVESVNAMRRQLGMESLPAPLIASYIGDGAPLLVRRALGPEASEEIATQALALYLTYYEAHLLDHTRPYDGVDTTLRRIAADAECRVAVLTNKPIRFSRAIIEGLGWSTLFFRVYGGDSFESRKPSPVGVERLMEEAGAAPERTVLVGDSATDVQAARNAGITACGVRYGFQPESLESSPPDLLLDTLAELPERLDAWWRAGLAPSTP
jgi:phosphoglycolate phosphatase